MAGWNPNAQGCGTGYTLSVDDSVAPIPTPGLVLHLQFDEPVGGSSFLDASGNGRIGTCLNANCPMLTSGIIGNAASYNSAEQDMVTLSTLVGLPDGNKLFTLAAWIKPAALGQPMGIIGWGNYGAVNEVNALRTSWGSECSNGQGLRHYFWGNDLDVCRNSIAVGQWAHVAVTYDGTTRRIYINGQEVRSNQPGTINIQLLNFGIGKTYGNEYFNGLIDDVRVYNQALSSAEVAALYSSVFSKAVFLPIIRR